MDTGFNLRRELLIAVLGPALVCLAIFAAVRVFGLEVPAHRLVPETGKRLALPGKVSPAGASLDEALTRARKGASPSDLRDRDPAPEDLVAVLRAAMPAEPSAAGDAGTALDLYAFVRGRPYFYDVAKAELGELTGAAPPSSAETRKVWVKSRLDPGGRGFHAPVVLVLCSPPSPTERPAAVDPVVPDPALWIAAAEARQRALLVARARGLVAVARERVSRRALASDLGLGEEQAVLLILVLSG